MSANNLIKIDRRNFAVSDCDADTGYGAKIGRGKTLEGAIDLAQEYQEQNIVEYGIRFTGRKQGKPKQKQ